MESQVILSLKEYEELKKIASQVEVKEIYREWHGGVFTYSDLKTKDEILNSLQKELKEKNKRIQQLQKDYYKLSTENDKLIKEKTKTNFRNLFAYIKNNI